MLCLAASSALATSSLQKKTNQLKSISANITQLKQTLNNARDKRATLFEELKRNDIELGQLENDLNNLNIQRTQQQTLIADLQSKQTDLESDLDKHMVLLNQQFRSAYQLGKNQPLKLLLNQESPNTLNRQLMYYRYINQARSKVINETQRALNAVTANEKQLRVHMQTLQHILTAKEKNKQQYLAAKAYNKQIINRLNETIQNKEQRLNELSKNKQSLERVVRRLQNERRLARLTGINFHKSRHQLPWPARGKLMTHFGQALQNSRLTSNGVFIEAPKNSNVQAIYGGRVVFANWLKGFGLLLIIDHNNGYMSLYAHNNSLYKKVGDQVGSGDLIAKVGNSGGNSENGLYFEIRHNGKPLNPESWCTKFA